MMKIIDTAEFWKWDDKTDDGEFSYTNIIAVNEEGEIFFSKEQDRNAQVELASGRPWSQIPTNHIYPQLSPNLSVYEAKFDESIYHKKPRFIAYDESPFLAKALLREAQIYELLRQHPCPSIAQYHGCIVANDRIIGLALTKYDKTLEARLKSPFETDEAAKWLSQITKGIEVLHENGLAHNDLSPSNIMISNGDAVIIDFDSCCWVGEDMIKCGTPGWCDESAVVSAVANDTFGLRRLSEALGIAGNDSDRSSVEIIESL